MHCRMAVSDDELRASRVYQEVLTPDGIEYTLGVSLVEEDETNSFLRHARLRWTRHLGPYFEVFGLLD
jgi:hypothetical protein